MFGTGFTSKITLTLSLIRQKGRPGETYNVGGRNERTNLEVVKSFCDALDRLNPDGAPHDRHIAYVTDRPGHDHRDVRHDLGLVDQR